MAKNSTLADLDAFLKEQETSEKNSKRTDSPYTEEEFVNQNPHQIIETEISAQAGNTVKEEIKKVESKIDTTVEIKKSTKNIASNHINNFIPNPKEEESIIVQWSKAIDETVKGSEMLRSVPLLSDITESSTEQLKATEKFFETSQNIWKKFWN